MVLFPEGTRITPEKLAAAQEFAAARALPVPRHVLIPRVKGLVASLAHLRPRLDAIVDVTIGYSERDPRSKRVRPSLGPAPPARAALAVRPPRAAAAGLTGPRGWAGDVMLRRGREWPVHVHVRVIPIEDVPTDEDALREWVLELFRDKDAALEELARRGAMPGAEMLRLPPPSARAALAGALSYSLPCFPLLLAAGLAAGHGAALWRGGGAG
jgi:1-acyl-sn-glycerol-3-phosphate acyltransferase